MSFIGNLNIFDHNNQEWQIFNGRLEQFIKLNTVADDKKGPLLLTRLSDESYRLAKNLVHPKKLEEVGFVELVNELNKHFSPWRCTFADREKFFEARRATGESVEGWAVRVRGLAVHCDFGSALDMLLVNRFVLGMNVGPERDRLFEQDATTLTFAKALDVAQQAASARQARAEASGAHVKEEPVYRVSGPRAGAERAREGRRCSVCGMKSHDADKCRYRNYRCQTCGVKGHLKKVCNGKAKNSSRLHNLVADPEFSDENGCENCKECEVFNVSSSASELISRRGVFSHRQYGSVEQMSGSSNSGSSSVSRRYRLENGDSVGEKDGLFGHHHVPILENPENETRWYFKYFLGKLHQNYIGLDTSSEPFLVTVVQEGAAGLLRAVIFNKKGSQKMYIPPSMWASDHRNPSPICPTVKQILQQFPSMQRLDKEPKEVPCAELQKDMLILEEQEGSVNFKFGVIFMKPGQKSDDEMLSNEFGDEKWNKFLELLGNPVRLKGWTRFRGGLDVNGDMTGLQSVFTVHLGHEIMFHVSTMLPYSTNNKQQLERKRHIGNDIINIIFTDASAHDTFTPASIKSHFTRVACRCAFNNKGVGLIADVFAVVSEAPGGYKLSVLSAEGVPPFGPSLPCPPVFTDLQLFRDFLLVKLMNGEKAAFQTPTFAQKRQRTLDMLIQDVYLEHCDKAPMLARRALSDVWSDAKSAAGAARSERFLHFGQAIKLDAVLRGDALTIGEPTRQRRRMPWQGEVWRTNPLPGNPICAEQIDAGRLLLSTNTNTYVLEETGTTRVVLRWEGCVRAARVTQRAGLFCVGARAAPGTRAAPGALSAQAGVYAVPVSQLYAGAWAMRPLQDCKLARLSRTKSAHFFDLFEQDDQMTLAVAVGRRVLLMTEQALDGAKGFEYVHMRDIVLCEVPLIIKYLTCTTGVLAAGYKHHWEVIDCEKSEILKRTDNATERRGTLVNALRIGDERDRQLVLCYSHTCHFERLNSSGLESDAQYDFTWTTVPYEVLNVFPYVIAFNDDLMEIRLLANGALVHTSCFPGLRLLCGRHDIFFLAYPPDWSSQDGELDPCLGTPDPHAQARRRMTPSSIDEEERGESAAGDSVDVDEVGGGGGSGAPSSASGSGSSEQEHVRPPLVRMAPVSPPPSPHTRGNSTSVRNVRVYKIPRASLSTVAPHRQAAAGGPPDPSLLSDRPSSIRQRLEEMDLEHKLRLSGSRDETL